MGLVKVLRGILGVWTIALCKHSIYHGLGASSAIMDRTHFIEQFLSSCKKPPPPALYIPVTTRCVLTPAPLAINLRSLREGVMSDLGRLFSQLPPSKEQDMTYHFSGPERAIPRHYHTSSA